MGKFRRSTLLIDCIHEGLIPFPGHSNKTVPVGTNACDGRTIGIQAIQSEYQFQMGMFAAHMFQQPFLSIFLTIIFADIDLLDDGFRHERQDFLHPGFDEAYGQ